MLGHCNDLLSLERPPLAGLAGATPDRWGKALADLAVCCLFLACNVPALQNPAFDPVMIASDGSYAAKTHVHQFHRTRRSDLEKVVDVDASLPSVFTFTPFSTRFEPFRTCAQMYTSFSSSVKH